MKKSISKVLMLILAVVLVTSSLGTTMAFAADTATLVLDSGAITISPVVNNPAQITVKQGATTTTLTAVASGNTVNVKQLNPLIATPNTITVNAGVNVNIKFITAVNIAPTTGSALTIGSGSTVNLVSALPSTLSNVFGSGGTLTSTSGALTVTGGISGCTLNANGGTLTVNGGISSVLKNVAPALNVTGGTLTLGSGAVNVPVSVKGGALTLSNSKASISSTVGVSGGTLTLGSGSISGAVTIAGGTLKQNAGSISGAVTLNSGNLTITGGTPPANLTVNGGIYTNGSTSYKQIEVTLPYLANPISEVTYISGASTTKAQTADSKFKANLPTSTTSFTAKANGTEYVITVAGTTATAKAKSTLQAPADIIDQQNTGTWFGRLNLPKTVNAKLGSGKDVPVNVTWAQGTYSSTITTIQTITSSTLTPPADIILDPPATATTIKVKLKYKSSGGGSSESQANPEYDFWRGVLSDVENASSGDTIYAYANSYSNMPSTILETLKGKNITLIITRKNGNDIKIYGKNIRSLESGRITYSISQLAELFKNGGTSSENASTSSKIPTTAPSTAPSTYVPPATSNAPATTVKPSSSSSSEESAASPEEEEPSSSEEEFEPSEPEVVPTDQPIEVTPKKKLSPLSIAIIVTVGAAILSGIVACIVLQRRNKHDQF